MTIEVQGPDGSSFQFPDGTPHDDVIAALAGHYDTAGPAIAGLAKAAGTGLAKGAIGVAGIPGDIGPAARSVGDWIGDRLGLPKLGADQEAAMKRPFGLPDVSVQLPTSAGIQGQVEKVTGQFHKPQTTPEKYVESAAEFLPGALAGPGGMARNAVRFGIAPGVAAEAAGELAPEPLKPWVRAGAALATGGVGAVLTRPSTASRAIRGQLPEGATPQVVDHAQSLIDDAAARGITLTWPEALSQVHGQPVLTDVQRVLESSPTTRAPMQNALSGRAQQIDHAAGPEFDALAPANAQPSTIGPAVATAAEGTLNDVRQAINTFTEPFYTRAAAVRLTPAEMAQVRALPGYPEAVDAIRADPQLARYVAGMPEESVGFLNEVKKYLDQQATNATRPMAQNPNMQRAAGYGQDAAAVRDVGTNASLDYTTALAVQADARERYLEPLLQGPLGRMADRPDTKNAIAALFPTNPLPNSQGEITTAVSALSRRSSLAAAQLVRAHAEQTFNEAMQNLQSGGNQWGGAKFAAVIAGNPQQRANLQAAIEALPGGAVRWEGFNRFLDIVQATGQRQPRGSMTAFNEQELRRLQSGSIPGNLAKDALSPGKWMSYVHDAWSKWQMGRNMNELATILTDPRSGQLLRNIAALPVNARQGPYLAGRLLANSFAVAPVAKVRDAENNPRH